MKFKTLRMLPVFVAATYVGGRAGWAYGAKFTIAGELFSITFAGAGVFGANVIALPIADWASRDGSAFELTLEMWVARNLDRFASELNATIEQMRGLHRKVGEISAQKSAEL